MHLIIVNIDDGQMNIRYVEVSIKYHVRHTLNMHVYI